MLILGTKSSGGNGLFVWTEVNGEQHRTKSAMGICVGQ